LYDFIRIRTKTNEFVRFNLYTICTVQIGLYELCCMNSYEKQFVLPNLSVEEEDDLEEKWPDGTLHFPFKHGNWEDFICHMEDDGLREKYYNIHGELPKFGLVWLGKRVIPTNLGW
jgi:hypothetical protein